MSAVENVDFPMNETTFMWLNSLQASTRSTYVLRLKDFFEFRKSQVGLSNFDIFRRYVQKLHDSEVPASSLWGVYSIVGKYWKNEFNEDLDNVGKAVNGLIKQWSKSEEIRKAKVRFHELKLFYIDYLCEDFYGGGVASVFYGSS
jgi:hypothetical protein